jgi:large subunit ribosomal protein L31
MKAQIHPQYFLDAKVICSSCGVNYVTGSTKQSIHVEVCSKCHPFYTGEHRFLDTKGKVEKFQKKQQMAAEIKAKKATLKKKEDDKGERKVKSLRELLGES